MKVLDLQCEHQHVFEGWCASEDDYQEQLERGLLSCPVCGATEVHRMPSAPRLNLGRGEPPAEAPVAPEQRKLAAIQAQMLRAMRELITNTEDVGERFAEEARAMHHGEIERRNIRGRTTPDVARELIEEGIDIVPLPDLSVIKETLQ
jgi:hypothetical protein